MTLVRILFFIMLSTSAFAQDSARQKLQKEAEEEDTPLSEQADKVPTLDKDPSKTLEAMPSDLESKSELESELKQFDKSKDEDPEGAVKDDDLKKVEDRVEKLGKDFDKLKNFDSVESLRAIPDAIEDLEKLPGLNRLKDIPVLGKVKDIERAVEGVVKDMQALENFKGVKSLDAIPDLLENLAKIPGLGSLKEIPAGKMLKEATAYLKKEETLKFHWELASEEGWGLALNIGFIADWDLNSLIAGIPDGSHLRVGTRLAMIGSFLHGGHEWRNKFVLAETFGFTPSIPVFIKSRDILSYETSYLYSIGHWFGAYGHFNINTAIFRGVDIQSVLVDYKITDDDNEKKEIRDVNHLRLTDPFLPLYMKEIVGMYARPFKLRGFTWELKAGGYALEVFADKQRKVVGKTRDGDVEIKTLRSFVQVGPSVGTHFFGIAFSDILIYKIGADLGYSAVDTSNKQSKFTDSLNLEAEASITVKPFSWLGVTWDGRVKYLTSIDNGFQIDNKVLLDFPFEF